MSAEGTGPAAGYWRRQCVMAMPFTRNAAQISENYLNC